MLRAVSLFCLSLFFAVSCSWAQSGALSGLLRDSETAEPLASANISIEGTTLGASTSADGSFLIPRVPPGTYVVRCALIGYATQELTVAIAANDSHHVAVDLEPEHIEEEEIVVTATRTARHISDVPVRVEVVPQEEVEEKLVMAPASVAMLLNESTGMRVQTTSATSNTANLRIQGLSGRYTQVLVDGIPNYGGLSSGFGLTQIPPLNLRQVDVIKGAASVLYGPDAISGVVNFITKEPREEPEFSAIMNGTTQRGVDLAAFFARQYEGVGLTLLGSRNTQPLYDVDADGFGDVAEYERYSFAPKVIFRPEEDVTVRIVAGVLSEHRVGGSTYSSGVLPGGGRPYREDLRSRRLDLSSQFDYQASEDEAVTVKIAAMQLRRDAVYGTTPFDATQRMVYADAQYARTVGVHALLFGAALSDEELADRTPVAGPGLGYRYTTPAAFLQDEITLSPEWSLLFGGRVDRHNLFGAVFTPRASAMYRASPSLTIRAGAGGGFRSPTIFTEEAEESGFRNVRPIAAPQAERATSASFDLNWRGIVGEVGMSVNFAAYLTDLSHALIADRDSLAGDVVYLRSASGATLSRGGECQVKLSHDELKLSVGYTYLYATQSDAGLSSELDLNPRHSFGAVLVWESERHAAKVGLENYWTGAQRLERHPSRDRSPAYWITGVVAEKGLGGLRLFVNFENIFDTRQTRYEPIIVGDARAGDVRTLPIYAPLEGRVINGGIRFVL